MFEKIREAIKRIDQTAIIDILDGGLSRALISLDYQGRVSVTIEIKIEVHSFSARHNFLLSLGSGSSSLILEKDEKKAADVIAGAIAGILSGPVIQTLDAGRPPFGIEIVINVKLGKTRGGIAVKFPVLESLDSAMFLV